MQQFARRPSDEPNDQSAPASQPPSDHTLAQLLDEITKLKATVVQLSEDVGRLKSGETEADSVSTQLVETLADPPTQANATAPELDLPVDEESIVELVRSSNPVAGTQLSDDEINTLLEEAARPQTSVLEPALSETVLQLDDRDETPKETTFEATQGIVIDRAIVGLVPSHLAIAALAVPVRVEGNTLICKSVEPFDNVSLDLIGTTTAHTVVAEPATMEEVVDALRVAYSDEAHSFHRNAAWDSAPLDIRPRKRGWLRRRTA